MDVDEINRILKPKYPLTSLQFLFVTHYAKLSNGMRAIREAGYKHSTPGSQSSAACRLLKLGRIQEAIELVRRRVQ